MIHSINGHSEPAGKANAINNFFIDIGPTLADHIPESILDPDYSFPKDRPEFNFTAVDQDTVSKLLRSISSNKIYRD